MKDNDPFLLSLISNAVAGRSNNNESEAVEENLSEMAGLAKADIGPGITVKKLKEHPFVHHVTVDGETAGYLTKHGKGSGKYNPSHYQAHPSLRGHGIGIDYGAAPWNVHRDNEGTPEHEKSKETWDAFEKANKEFVGHDAHTVQFSDLHQAVHGLASRHRVAKEFQGDDSARHAEAIKLHGEYKTLKNTGASYSNPTHEIEWKLRNLLKALPASHEHIRPELEAAHTALNNTNVVHTDRKAELGDRIRALTFDVNKQHANHYEYSHDSPEQKEQARANTLKTHPFAEVGQYNTKYYKHPKDLRDAANLSD
jgi:hypothetical protein